MLEVCADIIETVRLKKPLVHHLTNYVTVNDCANVTLAIGASPVMADAIEEAADMASIASALVLNIGTLNSRMVESMLAAGIAANAHGIPVVLDPVGAGATAYRNASAAKILDKLDVAVIRGNISEIRSVAGLASATKGVDASDADRNADARSLVRDLAKRLNCVVAATGKVDAVSDGTRTVLIENGADELERVSGTGCMCTSLVASCVGASPADPLAAAAAGILAMCLAGELALEGPGGQGLGAFHHALFDQIGHLNGATVRARGTIHETAG